MKEQFITLTISILYPILLASFIGFLAYLGKKVLKLIPLVIEFVVAKIGLTNYQKYKAIAWDVWNKGEEFFRLNPIIGSTIQAKILMFETEIRKKIPGITDAQIEDFRQAIAGEVNKDKPAVIKAIEDPVEIVTINPIKKYVDENGVELQPISAATSTAIAQ